MTDVHASSRSRTANRLLAEASPYLLQHAFNPVDWWPWGAEAFEAARRSDRPIFLSIGYSTCYWCHVMERECFESLAIASLMNDLFICIKVDREQRPDVDDLYMTGVQLLTGSGGWPMSMFLEPGSLKPFYGGTYFPPEDKFGRPGFPAVLNGVARAWKENRAAVLEQSVAVAKAIESQHAIDAHPVVLGRLQVDQAIAGLMSSYDRMDGGFGAGPRRAPKFPQPANLELLIGAAWDRKDVRSAVLHTLDRMATGGMYDQVGGGFHRYSVDEKWLVPHFEKMLYDNAQLASTYAHAFELRSDAFYAWVVRRTLNYVRREMTSPEGGFFSAQDAEVDALEGGNYLWTADEITQTMREAGMQAGAAFALQIYGVDQGPNFVDPHHPEAGRKNVLFLPQRFEQLAEAFEMPAEEFSDSLRTINHVLLAARIKRLQPATDDKVLAGWNGLMIAGMADGGRVLDEPMYVDAAKAAAEFILTKMRGSDGGLLRSSRGGAAAQIDGFLEDYAFMIRGLLALHRATAEERWLDDAIRLADAAKDRFWDRSGGGGFFDTRAGQNDLFVRIRSVYDGAVPSGNSVMLLNLLDLHERTGDERWLNEAKAAMAGLSSAIANHPSGSALAILALDRMNRMNAMPAVTAAPAIAADKVAVSLSTNDVAVKAGTKANVDVVIDIAQGWHVNSRSPGDASVIPLQIELAGCEGLGIEPRYPVGVSFNAAGTAASVNVHSGRISVPVSIELTGEIKGRPQLVVTYQACDDKVCLQPKRVAMELRVVATR